MAVPATLSRLRPPVRIWSGPPSSCGHSFNRQDTRLWSEVSGFESRCPPSFESEVTNRKEVMNRGQRATVEAQVSGPAVLERRQVHVAHREFARPDAEASTVAAHPTEKAIRPILRAESHASRLCKWRHHDGHCNQRKRGGVKSLGKATRPSTETD